MLNVAWKVLQKNCTVLINFGHEGKCLGMEKEFPFQPTTGIWGSVLSFFSGLRGKASAENDPF